MNAYELMMRLGLSLAGTNADLSFVAPPSDEGGDEGESGDGSDEQGDDEQGDGGSESGDGSGGEGDRDMDGGGEGESSGVPSDAKSGKGKQGKSNTKGKPEQSEQGGKGAGGGSTTRDGEQFDAQAFAQSLVEAMANGDESGVKDLANALSEAVKAAHEDGEGKVENGEALWNPYTTANDKVVRVPAGPDARDAGQKLLESVRREVSFLRARLRNKFLEAKAPRVMHGVKNGETLSERLLANTWIEVQSGIAPTRPDTRTVHRDKVSIAVAVVVDQSGSMQSRKTEAARALVAVCAPLDEVGCPVLAVGFRNGYDYATPDASEQVDPSRPYHRTESVDIDVFKAWDEPVRNCLGRFTKVKATGGTPMCDGIQFALQALSARKERHRILLVITDGEPDWGHSPVIRRQQRLAREAGIALVGVGIDYGCRSVENLYEKHVLVEDVSKLPEQLLKTINDLVFPRGNARSVALDGKMKAGKGRAA
jgi:cobalamin biosynthesis protein CobT